MKLIDKSNIPGRLIKGVQFDESGEAVIPNELYKKAVFISEYYNVEIEDYVPNVDSPDGTSHVDEDIIPSETGAETADEDDGEDEDDDLDHMDHLAPEGNKQWP